MSKFGVVIATCREDSINRWIDAWRSELQNCVTYIVEDNPVQQFRFPYVTGHRYAWNDIDSDLGAQSWIIPRRTSAIKSYGFLKAYQDGCDYIWTLDDDCFPEGRPEGSYIRTLQTLLDWKYEEDSWWNTLPQGLPYPRGYPYGIRQSVQQAMIHHGLWSGVPDLDGITALEHADLRLNPATRRERIPIGKFFPMCGMNLAFRREMTPAMYFGLQGSWFDPRDAGARNCNEPEPLPYDRFDDIWAGLFIKKVCDHLGYAITSGAPSIVHTKESDPIQRVIKEGPGIAAHELLWKCLVREGISPGVGTVKGSYEAMAQVVLSCASGLPNPDYWRKLAKAMRIWTELF